MSVISEHPPDAKPRMLTCGTVKYTTFGLIMVFIWLLWGDFIWTLLDGSIPGILPFKLRDMGASDTTNQVLNRSLAYAIAFLFAPAVGYISDRHRGRWGRRIPYLLWSTPFVGLFMVLIGYYENLAGLFFGTSEQVSVLGLEIGRASFTIALFGALFIGYDFSNVFVGTLYWYLFNDVVPQKVMTRYFALFRIVGLASGAIFSKWIFPWVVPPAAKEKLRFLFACDATSQLASMVGHAGGAFYQDLVLPFSLDLVTPGRFRFLFVVAGIAYVVGYMIMCIMVKEGQYPPPPPRAAAAVEPGPRSLLSIVRVWLRKLLASAKTFAKECFTHRFYWYFFLTSTCFFLSGQAGMFRSLRDRDSLLLTPQQLGDLGALTNIVTIFIMFPVAWLADKFHPMRAYVVMTLVCFLSPLAQCIWIFTDFGPHGNLVGQYLISFAILPLAAVGGLVEIPMYMRVLPQERYGQFCSANAALRSLAMIPASVLAGLMMDALSRYAGMDEWRYRFYSAWQVAFTIPGLIFMLLMYREWKARGGAQGYTPPPV